MNTTDQLSTRKPTIADKVRRWCHRLVRAFRWCFVRRLAIKPLSCTNGYVGDNENRPQRMMFEWQKMPENWRWF